MFQLIAAGFVLAGLLFAQTSSPEALLQRAVELQQRGDLEAAVKSYRDFLAVRPNEIAERSNLGVLLARLGRFDEAIAEYKKALDLEPGNASVSLNLGLAYYKSGRIPEAAADFLMARKMAPGNLQIALLLADCELRMGQNGAVIELLRPIEQQHPDDLAILYLLGTALIRDNQVEEGQRRVDRILKNGDSAEARFLLGSQMFFASDFPSAVKQFARAIELNPTLPDLQSLYGQALLNTGDPDAAIDAFQKELTSNPNDFAANLYLAEVFIERRKWSEAGPLLTRALLIRPDSTAAKQDLAMLKARDETGLSAERPNGESGLRPGDQAPEFTVSRMGAGDPVTLSQLRKSRPLVLVFGSYTCPNFRAAADSLNKLYGEYRDQIGFDLIYIREAHSTADWQSSRNEREGIVLRPAANMDERQEHAIMCVRKLHLAFPALLDGMAGSVEKAYSAWPSRAYVVDGDGRIVFSTGLSELDFKPDRLEAAIRTASGTAKEKSPPRGVQ